MLFDAAGFSCVDGFSENDIYMPQAVKEMSGISMVMNGGKFIFPATCSLNLSVVVRMAAFISVRKAVLYLKVERSTEDDSSGELTLPFRQMVWYENCV